MRKTPPLKRRPFHRLPIILFFLLGSIGGAIAAESCKSDPKEPLETTIYSLRINGRQPSELFGEGNLVLESRSAILLRERDAELLRLKFEALWVCEHEGVSYVSLRNIPGMFYRVEPDTQTLSLSAGVNAFREARLDNASEVSGIDAFGDTGAFLNYDLGFEKLDKSMTANGLFEIGHFNRLGLLTSTFIARDFNKSPARLETTVVYDLPKKDQSIRLGDSVTRTGAWGRSLYFGGLQWGTDFGLEPERVRFPLPALRGEAVSPSTAQLYVNNALRWSQQVQPGPFEIQNAPVISGVGQVTLVVRDALGRETLTSQSYFASTKLLQQGLSDFSFSLGALRKDLGFSNFKYSRGVVSGLYRRGLTGRLTTEVRGEAIGKTRVAGVSATAQVLGPIVATGGIGGSDGENKKGALVLAGIEYQNRFVSFGAQAQLSRGAFIQPGIDVSYRQPPKQYSAYLGFTTFGRDHFNFSKFRQSGESAILYDAASYTVNFKRNLFWSTTLTRSSVGYRQLVATTSLVFQLGERMSASTGVVRHGSDVREEFSLQRNRPIGPGLGYRVNSRGGAQRQVYGEAILAKNTGEYSTAVSRTRAGAGLRLGARGAFGFIKGKLFRTRRIDDAFALVKIGNYKNVKVLADNQLIARTDASGTAIVPRLLSYQRNQISIDPGDLPADVAVDRVNMQIKPRRRVGVHVGFATKSDAGVVIRILDSAGQPVPLGASVLINGQSVESRVGVDGTLYLPAAMLESTHLTFQWPAGQCSVVTDREKAKSGGLNELSLTCAR